MTDAEALDRSIKARAVLESPAFLDAYTNVRRRLLEVMLAAKYEDVELAEDSRRSIKLLDSLKAELDTAISSGKVATDNIAEIEKRRRNPLRGIFR